MTRGLHRVQDVKCGFIELDIDSHFYGLTPLNAPNEGDIVAE